MDYGVFNIDEIADEKLVTLIKERQDFVIANIPFATFPEAVTKIETLIESQGLKCRIYSKGRVAALAAETVVGGLGILAGIGIAAHNTATWDPDYEVAKNRVMGTLTVTYKRKPDEKPASGAS